MSVQYYSGSPHLEPNKKYRVTIILPGVNKTWSFTSRYLTNEGNEVYTTSDLVAQHLREFAAVLSKAETYGFILGASNRVEDLILYHKIETEGFAPNVLTAFNHVRKMFVTFQAGLDVASSIYFDLVHKGGRYAKRLGDLQIDNQSMAVIPRVEILHEYLEKERDYWLARLLSFLTGSTKPRAMAVVRGSTTSPYPLDTRIF